MWLIKKIAEDRINEAMARGEFDDLPGAGKPLALDDDVLVPEELRAAYRLLKNAGYLPPELELRREIADAQALLACAQAEEERLCISRRLNYLMTRLSLARGGRDLRIEDAYYQKLCTRLGGER